MALTDKQRELRQKGIGGSEIGAVAGLSPFASPRDVWAQKLGLAPPVVEDANMRRGRILEPAIANWWAEEVGAEEMTEPGTLVDARTPIVIATPDRVARVRGEKISCQVKAPGKFGYEWGKSGTDEVPAYILAQTHWEMRVLELARCHVAAFADGELRVYPIERDADFEAMLLEEGEAFWRHYVQTGVEPPSMSRGARARLKLADLDASAKNLVDTYLRVRKDFARLEDQKQELERRVKQLLGASEGLEVPGGRIDWKQNRDSTVTDWEAVAVDWRGLVGLHAEQLSLQLVADLLKGFDEARARHTTVKQGARPFKVYVKEAA